eukprot:9484739-Pyramimonas_sp.AAC.1
MCIRDRPRARQLGGPASRGLIRLWQGRFFTVYTGVVRATRPWLGPSSYDRVGVVRATRPLLGSSSYGRDGSGRTHPAPPFGS